MAPTYTVRESPEVKAVGKHAQSHVVGLLRRAEEGDCDPDGVCLRFALQYPGIQRVDGRADGTHDEVLLPHGCPPLLPSSPHRLEEGLKHIGVELLEG